MKILDSRSLVRLRVRGDGGVDVVEPQHFLEDGGPATVLRLAGHTEDLLVLLNSPLEVLVTVITDDVALTIIIEIIIT